VSLSDFKPTDAQLKSSQAKALYFIGRPPYPMPMTSFNLNASYYYGFFGYPSEARRRA